MRCTSPCPHSIAVIPFIFSQKSSRYYFQHQRKTSPLKRSRSMLLHCQTEWSAYPHSAGRFPRFPAGKRQPGRRRPLKMQPGGCHQKPLPEFGLTRLNTAELPGAFLYICRLAATAREQKAPNKTASAKPRRLSIFSRYTPHFLKSKQY